MKIKKVLSKKAGIEMDETTKLVLIIIAGIILFAVVGYLIYSFWGISDVEACRLSALGAANTKLFGKDSPIVQLKCKTHFVDVQDKKIMKDQKKIQDINQKIEEDQVKRAIANEMYDCWYQLGAGEYDLFGHASGNSQCVICSYIDFSQDYSSRHGSVENFDRFIAEKKLPGKNQTYLSYLSKDTGEKWKSLDPLPLSLDTTQEYTILYYSTKEDFKTEVKASAITGIAAGITVCSAGVAFTVITLGAGSPVGGALCGTAGLLVTSAVAGGTTYKLSTKGEGDNKYLGVLVLPTEVVGDKCETMY